MGVLQIHAELRSLSVRICPKSPRARNASQHNFILVERCA